MIKGVFLNLFDFDFSKEKGESKLIFFDTETTGNGKDDEIIQIGAIVEDLNGNLIEYFDELCSSNKLIAPEAMATHGIRNEDLLGKKPFTQSTFWQKIDTFNRKQNYFIAHNLPFDLERLQFYGFRPKAKLIDTLQCAKHLFKEDEILGEYNYPLPNYKLQTFRYILFNKAKEEAEAKKFGITLQAHSALSDVIILKMFFNELLKRVCQECTKKEALEKLVELSTKPVLVEKFKFGKYKGQKIQDIVTLDRGYVEWLYNDMLKRQKNGESVDENIFLSLKFYLEA